MQRVKEMKDDEGFNAQTERYENLVQAGVIDPTKVVRSALQNAASIASLLLTTEAVISQIPEQPSARAAAMGGMGGGDVLDLLEMGAGRVDARKHDIQTVGQRFVKKTTCARSASSRVNNAACSCNLHDGCKPRPGNGTPLCRQCDSSADQAGDWRGSQPSRIPRRKGQLP